MLITFNTVEMCPHQAYAKLHGSYEAIEAGFMDQAMADLTGGLGSRIDLTKIESKQQVRWILLVFSWSFLFDLKSILVDPKRCTVEHTSEGLQFWRVACRGHSSWKRSRFSENPSWPRSQSCVRDNRHQAGSFAMGMCSESLLRLQADTYRLIRLRNPWGRHVSTHGCLFRFVT